jgi:hypothetical protein
MAAEAKMLPAQRAQAVRERQMRENQARLDESELPLFFIHVGLVGVES